MRKQCLILITILIVACNNNKENNIATTSAIDTSTDTGTVSVMIPTTKCYQSIRGKDTVYLKLEKFPNVVTGILKYKFYEKDSNAGELDGKLHGDTLIADYSFKSEGTVSVRQVAFLIKDSVATEGYTDMEEKEAKMIFKNTGNLDFSKGLKLKQIDCPLE